MHLCIGKTGASILLLTIQKSSIKYFITIFVFYNYIPFSKWPMGLVVECLPKVRETGVQSKVESNQRLKKWYLIPPCLTFSIIRYVSRVKWSNQGKEVGPSPTPWCSSYWKGGFQVALKYGCQLYLLTYHLIFLWCLYSELLSMFLENSKYLVMFFYIHIHILHRWLIIHIDTTTNTHIYLGESKVLQYFDNMKYTSAASFASVKFVKEMNHTWCWVCLLLSRVLLNGFASIAYGMALEFMVLGLIVEFLQSKWNFMNCLVIQLWSTACSPFTQQMFFIAFLAL